ncbi:MAG: DUF3800 domain-containing protein [Chloroflexi bacterium]|jgi:hypothetical protein|nr:DUF3800 domain-containing protein [Chloroflexota bacterium]
MTEAAHYKAFFDESGTHVGAEVIAVGGFLADAESWKTFCDEWQTALDYNGLDYFHMTDYENIQGPYLSWTDKQGRDCINQLLDIIHRYVIQSVGIIIPLRSFDQIMSDRAKSICGDAYGLAAIQCWANLASTARHPKINAAFEIVMEDGAKGKGALIDVVRAASGDTEWFENNRIKSLSFEDKREFPPLQAADILAYELYKHGLRQFGSEKRPDRYPLRQLQRSYRQWHYLDDSGLREADDWPANLRLRGE